MSTPTDQPDAVVYPFRGDSSPGNGTPPPSTETPSVAPASPDNPPWGLPSAVGVLLASIALLVFVPVLAIIPYVIWRHINPQMLGEMMATDKTLILISIVATFPAHILTLALVWAVVTRFGKRPFWSALGWNWSPRFGFWSSAGTAVGLFVLGIIIFRIFGDQETALVRLLNSSMAARYSIVVMATLTAPLVEEVVYRGLFYSALQRRVGMVWGVVGVMFIFALIHVPQYYPSFGAISTIGLLSLALTLLRAYTGRLLPCVVVHTIFNGLSSVSILLEPFVKHLPSVTEQPTSTLILAATRVVRLVF